MSEFINTIDVLGDDAVIDSIIQKTITEFKDSAVQTFGGYSFYNCTELTNVDAPACTNVDANAFKGCTSLKEFNAPNLASVQDNAFNGCTSLERFDLPKSTRYWDLKGGAFKGCTSLKEFNAPNQTELLYDSIFAGCVELVKVNMPNINLCPLAMFEGCIKLKQLDFNRLTEVGNRAFSGSGLDTLIIRSESVCKLGHAAAFKFGSNTSPIEEGTGYIYVPKTLVDSYKAATNWSTYADQIRAIEDYPDITGG